MPDAVYSPEYLNLLAAFALLQMEWKDKEMPYTIPLEVAEEFLHFCSPTQNAAVLLEFWFQSHWIFQVSLRRWQLTGKGLATLIEQGAKLPIDENGVVDWIRTYTPR